MKSKKLHILTHIYTCMRVHTYGMCTHTPKKRVFEVFQYYNRYTMTRYGVFVSLFIRAHENLRQL